VNIWTGAKDKFCPVCKRKELRSALAEERPPIASPVESPYWDHDGHFVANYHWRSSGFYRCSRGHRWTEWHSDGSDPDFTLEEGSRWL
jgi:hypothetical protein